MKILKKLIAVLCCTVMLTGCASSDESSTSQTDGVISTTEYDGEAISSDADGTMLYQSERVNVKFISEMQNDMHTSLLLEVENLTDERFMISANDISVNGVMIDPFLYAICEGKTTTQAAMEFYNYDLEESGISELGSVEFSFFVTDGLSAEGLESSEVITLDLREAAEPEKPEGIEIYNENGLEVLYTGMNPDESTNATASFYINNSTGNDICVDVINIKIDGEYVTAEMFYPINKDRSRFCEMYFWDEGVLLENSETLEFELGAIHPETYEAYLETGNLTIDLQSMQD